MYKLEITDPDGRVLTIEYHGYQALADGMIRIAKAVARVGWMQTLKLIAGFAVR